MHKKFTFWILAALSILMVACTAPLTEDRSETESASMTESVPAEVQLQAGQLRQWATSAEASTEFANPEWSAEQATGLPDTFDCGDRQTAWASAASDSEDWLQLNYPVAVYVTQVNIIQTFNPNQIIKVDLIGADGRSSLIYDGKPVQIDRPCPFTLSIPIERTLEPIDTVRITLDQSVLGLGWNEIDAVELVGEED